MDIMEGAKLLGIVMDDLQVVFRDKKHVENSVVEKIPEPEYGDNLIKPSQFNLVKGHNI